MKIKDPTKYLDRHLEKKPWNVNEQQKFEDTLLNISLTPEEFAYDEEGECEFQKDHLKINFVYEKLTDEIEKNFEFIKQHFPEKLVDLNLNNYRVLKKFTLQNVRISDNNKDNKLDLFNDIECLDRINIIFNIHKKETYAKSMYDNWSKLIVLSGDIANLRVIVTLLHEIGHINIKFKKTTQENVIDDVARHNMPENSESYMAETLNEERKAHSFALNILKKFFGKNILNKKDVMKFIHEVTLSSYSTNIKLARIIREINQKKKGLEHKKDS